MRLTTDVLWDYLRPTDPKTIVYNCIKKKCEFNSVRQHPNKEHVFVENAIYVIDYEKFEIMNGQPERFNGNTFIFVNSKNDKNFKPENCAISCFVIMKQSIMDVFTNVSDIAVDFNNWAERINDALINNASIDDLVAIGQEYIINPFIILDEALNLISHTDNISDDDKTFQDTIEKGYTPPTLIAEIMKKRGSKKQHFNVGETYDDAAIIPNEEVNQPVVLDDKIVAVVYVHCTVVKPSAGSADVLRYFAGKLAYYFKHNKIESVKYSTDNKQIGQFLGYILRHELEPKEIQLMAEAADYPYTARFNMFVLEPAVSVGQKYLLNRVIETLPQERCFANQDKIVIVSAFIWKNSSAEEHLVKLLDKIKKLMEDNQCYVGQSREFTNLSQFSGAYIQANAALRIGKKLLNKKNKINDFGWKPELKKQIFNYDMFSLHHMLENCAKELPLKNMCSPQILSMLEHDRNKGTDNYKVLYTYLENDRITSEAAELLHMHRNNVNYRIKRIEEMFGIDLSDNEERLRIQMSFRILDLLDNEE